MTTPAGPSGVPGAGGGWEGHVRPAVPGPIAVLGTGLVGGSLLRALLAYTDARLQAWDPDPQVRDELRVSLRSGAGRLEVPDGLPDSLAGASLVVLAAPVPALVSLGGQVARLARSRPGWFAPAAVVTDVGSVKGPLLAGLPREFAASGLTFIGGHPMAGSEQGGFAGARADLFQGCTWLVCPPEAERAPSILAAVQVVTTLARDVGAARVVTLAAPEHDRLVAAISHLPQVAAYALSAASTGLAGDNIALAGPGFRDTTRLAASDPSLWAGIALANRAEVLVALHRLRAELDRVVEALTTGDGQRVAEAFRRGRRVETDPTGR